MLHGLPCTDHISIPLPLTYRSQAFEVCAIGIVDGQDCETQRLESKSPSTFRALITRKGVLVGVQMIGTHEGFDDYAARVQPTSPSPGTGNVG